MTSYIDRNLKIVKERIEYSAVRAGRDPSEITLVAVSKTCSAAAVVAASNIGIQHFGENRVEEASDKIPLVAQLRQGDQPTIQSPNLTWHLIGHLQSRKAKQAAELFGFIQSIDSFSLATKLEQHAAGLDKTIPVLLEVNISGESTKFGLRPDPRDAFVDAVRTILTLPHLDVQGLMTVAPIVQQPDLARPFFRDLRILRDELRILFPHRSWPHLSMGMTDDFQVGIAEGATIVRIGRAIFGERNQQEQIQ
jgi:PLP dependent protein